MSEEEFLRCLSEFHGPAKFREFSKTTVFNRNINLYDFYLAAKRRGEFTDAIIITQWRDICVEIGLLNKGERITVDQAYRTSQFLCDCFIDFSYPELRKKYQGKRPKQTKPRPGKKNSKVRKNSNKLAADFKKILSGKLSKILISKRNWPNNESDTDDSDIYFGLDETYQYENLIWMARNIMNVPKFKFFSNKDSNDCSLFENQWVLPSYDSSVPLSYKTQSKVACAAKLAAETADVASQASDELLSRSSDSEYDLVLRECGLAENEFGDASANNATDEGDCSNVIVGSVNELSFSNASGYNNIFNGTNSSRNSAETSKSSTKRKKHMIINLIHEVAKYLIAGHEIEICLNILLKSLTVVKLPKIPGLCRQIAHINVQLSKELIKYVDFKMQRGILSILDVLCNILSLIVRDAFVDYTKHKYDNTYHQSFLCLESLQISSCILFLKINEAFHNSKFKHNSFNLDLNTQDKGPIDAVNSTKTTTSSNTAHSSSIDSQSSCKSNRSNSIHSQLYNTVVSSNRLNTVDSDGSKRPNLCKLSSVQSIHESIKNKGFDRKFGDNAPKVNGNADSSKLYKAKVPSSANSANLSNNGTNNNGGSEPAKYSKAGVPNSDSHKHENGDEFEHVNHLEILSNVLLLIRFLSVISTELWQFDMICSVIDPLLKTVFNVMEDNRAPEYWLWDDFQKALCVLFSSCYCLSKKMEGKMQIETVVNLYFISFALLKQKISKILFRKIVQMILSFHIYFDFQMFNFMNYAIRSTCEILVQISVSSFPNDFTSDPEDKQPPSDADSWCSSQGVAHLDPLSKRRAALAPCMNRLFLNAGNPINNPWSSVPIDSVSIKEETLDLADQLITVGESIIDYVKISPEADNPVASDPLSSTNFDCSTVDDEHCACHSHFISNTSSHYACCPNGFNEVYDDSNREADASGVYLVSNTNTIDDEELVVDYYGDQIDFDLDIGWDIEFVGDSTDYADNDDHFLISGTSVMEDPVTRPGGSKMVTRSKAGVNGSIQSTNGSNNFDGPKSVYSDRHPDHSFKGRIKAEDIGRLFNYASLPKRHALTLDESILFLQDYYRGVFGIRSRLNIQGCSDKEECADDKLASCSFSDLPDDDDCELDSDQRSVFVDKQVYDSFKRFQNTREIVAMCIAKMTEYSFCLDVVRNHYDKILECAYNDRCSRFFWPVIHKLQLADSCEPCDGLDNYEIMSIEQIK